MSAVTSLKPFQASVGTRIDRRPYWPQRWLHCNLPSSAYGRAGGPKVKVRNVLLLAPAARADLFYDEIVSKEDRYEALRIFTMSDNYECKDRLAGPLYTRSLLYFIGWRSGT